MEPIKLTPHQQKLKEEIIDLLQNLKMKVDKNFTYDQEYENWHKEMGNKAHELHLDLKNHGIQVKHHKYMIENRELDPEHPDFYHHVHPVEDLLAFLEDPSANDDPEDKTIGDSFDFKVYTNRWGHEDNYRITRTETGWYVSHIAINGDCDKEGQPYLFKNLEQDQVAYPSNLGTYFLVLWNEAEEYRLSHEEVQERLDRLADWVSLTEKTKPTYA